MTHRGQLCFQASAMPAPCEGRCHAHRGPNGAALEAVSNQRGSQAFRAGSNLPIAEALVSRVCG